MPTFPIQRHTIPDHRITIRWACDSLARTVLAIFGRYQRKPARPSAIPYRIVSPTLAAYYVKRDRLARTIALCDCYGPDHTYSINSAPHCERLNSAYRAALRQLTAIMPPPE